MRRVSEEETWEILTEGAEDEIQDEAVQETDHDETDHDEISAVPAKCTRQPAQNVVMNAKYRSNREKADQSIAENASIRTNNSNLLKQDIALLFYFFK
jgi:hypothetical protein